MATEEVQKQRGAGAGALQGLMHKISRTRFALVLGFLAVFLPLIILLTLQYRWLVDLEKNSGFARRGFLTKFLESVEKQVYYIYVTTAERTLNIPASLFEEEKIQKIAVLFKKSKAVGAQRLFVVSFLSSNKDVFFLDEKTGKMIVPKFSQETLAVWAASAPWAVLAEKGTTLESPSLEVDERDHDNRIILKPITDERYRVVGLAGMIIDPEFFQKKILPKAIKEMMPELSKSGELVLVVWDQDGQQVWPEASVKVNLKQGVVRSPSFIFKDWRLALVDQFVTPEVWARKNFAFNMTLSVVLALVLLAGISLALRVAAREMRLSTMKSDFVSNVSHELRTPLASIRVFAEFMRLGRVTDLEKVREYGEYIETESRRLTQLVNNILDFSRIESGRKIYVFDETDVEPIVTSAIDAFALRVRNAGFGINYHGPEKPLPSLRLDAGAIDQAVCNLLENAVKYSGDSRTVDVYLSGMDGRVLIAVSDRGIGIPAIEQKRIFDRFHRVSTGLIHEVRGSGLGLAIVKHIVTAHGGQVTVTSEAGKGSTFTIELPSSTGDSPSRNE